MYDEPEAALGVVPLAGRGHLPYLLVHGESLVAAASWALGAAGIDLFDLGTTFEAIRDSGRDLVVHDPLCPLAPAEFLVEALGLARETGEVVVGVRPVTDTVKEHVGDLLGATVPREDLVAVATPLVLPAGVLAELEDLDVTDLAAFVATLAAQRPVRQLEAPALARRIAGEDDLEVLAALSRVSR